MSHLPEDPLPHLRAALRGAHRDDVLAVLCELAGRSLTELERVEVMLRDAAYQRADQQSVALHASAEGLAPAAWLERWPELERATTRVTRAFDALRRAWKRVDARRARAA